MKKRTIIEIIVLIVVVGLGIYAIPRAQELSDKLFLLRYEPPQRIEQLANASGMNDTGRRLFYRHTPSIVPESELDSACDVNHMVLGCISDNVIYIGGYEGDAKFNRAIVTAAHEMLHIQYQRFSEDKRKEVDSLVESVLGNIPRDAREFIDGYSPESRLLEAYAIIGSQFVVEDQKLWTIFGEVFEDRGKSIAAYEKSPEGEN